jgi:hypothetical protein
MQRQPRPWKGAAGKFWCFQALALYQQALEAIIYIPTPAPTPPLVEPFPEIKGPF